MRHSLPAVTAALLLAVTGCSGSPTSAGPSDVVSAAVLESPPVHWMNEVCGSLLPLGPATQSAPRIDRSNAAATLQGLSGFFSTLVDAFDLATRRLGAVGASPVKGGDVIVVRLTDALGSSRTVVQNAKTAIDKVDVNNPRALAAELPAALTPLHQLSTLPNPTSGLAANPELDSAAVQAPNCRTFSTAAAAATTRPPG